MIEHLSKEILDKAYLGFHADKDMVASEKRFSQNSLKELSFAIKEMFQMLEIDKDLSILNDVRIICLGKLDFAEACFCNSWCQDYFYVCNIQTNEHAKEIYKVKSNLKSIRDIEVDAFEKLMLEDNGDTFACSNKHNILLNSEAISSKFGLHLVCHEIMHTLASPLTVQNLRKQSYGDEAINEFFARLATLIFNSIKDGNSEISGYTLWDGDFGYPHSKELGLYGSLMAKDENLQNEDWNDPNLAVECCKKLAKLYFLNID